MEPTRQQILKVLCGIAVLLIAMAVGIAWAGDGPRDSRVFPTTGTMRVMTVSPLPQPIFTYVEPDSIRLAPRRDGGVWRLEMPRNQGARIVCDSGHAGLFCQDAGACELRCGEWP